jgi:hypothetical protein
MAIHCRAVKNSLRGTLLYLSSGFSVHSLVQNSGVYPPLFCCNYFHLDFFGPKWHWLRSLSFQGPKKSRFQGPPLIMALVIDIARLKIITYRAIKTTGTLIVNINVGVIGRPK